MLSVGFLKANNDTRRGIIWMLLGGMWFAGLNVTVKYLGHAYSIYEIAFMRSFIAVLIAIVANHAAGHKLRDMKTRNKLGHFLRALFGTASMLGLFYSLKLLPLADVTAIYYTAPLFITLISILFLKEQVRPYHWLALVLGLIGVLVIVEPGGDGVNLYGVGVALGSAVAYALAMTGLRVLGRTESSNVTVFYFSLQATIYTALPLPWVWQTPDLKSFILLVAGGIFAGMGQMCLTRAYQCAPASVVSPFGYATIVWATVLGFLFWSEVPRWTLFVGGALVIISGLSIYYYAMKQKKPLPVPNEPA